MGFGWTGAPDDARCSAMPVAVRDLVQARRGSARAPAPPEGRHGKRPGQLASPRARRRSFVGDRSRRATLCAIPRDSRGACGHRLLRSRKMSRAKNRSTSRRGVLFHCIDEEMGSAAVYRARCGGLCGRGSGALALPTRRGPTPSPRGDDGAARRHAEKPSRQSTAAGGRQLRRSARVALSLDVVGFVDVSDQWYRVRKTFDATAIRREHPLDLLAVPGRYDEKGRRNPRRAWSGSCGTVPRSGGETHR